MPSPVSGSHPLHRLAYFPRYALNYEGWGGHHDWCLRAYGWAAEAGALEADLHAEFQHQHVPLHWDRNYVPKITKEAYL